MRSRSSDYIPTAGDLVAEAEAREARLKEVKDPRHEYKFKYTWNGNERVETVMAMNAEDAEKLIKSQWSLVGVNLTDLVCVNID